MDRSDGTPKQPNSAPTSGGNWSRRDLLQLTGVAAAFAAVFPGEGRTEPFPPPPPSQTESVRLTTNGRLETFVLDTRQSLLDLLRERLALTGTKKGCNQGACGACTVLLDGQRVNSCLTLAAMHDGASITTIEGLATGDALHPLQAAFIEHEGFQCGYCTSGQIMSGVACIAEGHCHSADEISFWMSGNICRCGAYPGIVAAIAEVGGGA
jgi:xanthine dehydrogenase YagT iron-sulfur-binding subunit